MSGVRFEPTLNFGHVLQAGALLVAAVMFFGSIRAEQALTSAEISETKRRLAAVETNLGELTRQNTQLTRSVDRLSYAVEHRSSASGTSAGGNP